MYNLSRPFFSAVFQPLDIIFFTFDQKTNREWKIKLKAITGPDWIELFKVQDIKLCLFTPEFFALSHSIM